MMIDYTFLTLDCIQHGHLTDPFDLTFSGSST